MKKISLKNLNLLEIEPLSREELKNVFGGGDDEFESGTADACQNKQGGCDYGDNCKRSSGAAGKCGTGTGTTCTCT